MGDENDLSKYDHLVKDEKADTGTEAEAAPQGPDDVEDQDDDEDEEDDL